MTTIVECASPARTYDVSLEACCAKGQGFIEVKPKSFGSGVVRFDVPIPPESLYYAACKNCRESSVADSWNIKECRYSDPLYRLESLPEPTGGLYVAIVFLLVLVRYCPHTKWAGNTVRSIMARKRRKKGRGY